MRKRLALGGCTGVDRKPPYMERQDTLVLILTTAHSEAMSLGLYATGHAIHDAVRRIGWELAQTRNGGQLRADRKGA